MARLKVFLLVALGALLSLAGERLYHSRPVHAQSYLNGVACSTRVPAGWGQFKGASGFGLAFEDEKGNLRFLQHPPCMSGSFSSSDLAPNVDLYVERK